MLSTKELFVGCVASCACHFQCHHPFPLSPMIMCVCVLCACTHSLSHKEECMEGGACFLFFLCVQCTFEGITLVLSK